MTTKLLAALFSWFLTLIGLAGPAETIGQNFSINAGDDLQSCDDIQVRSDEYEIARGDESFSIPLNRAVKVTPSQNGGVWIVGASGSDVEVHACKIAAASTAERAQQLLANVRVTNQGGTIT